MNDTEQKFKELVMSELNETLSKIHEFLSLLKADLNGSDEGIQRLAALNIKIMESFIKNNLTDICVMAEREFLKREFGERMVDNNNTKH